ncbi:MAG: hypothetical protein A2047_05295 [Omnitrophica bacterium GWA2_41_15]|nr:MAG: hypothetical protein A2047_05295 [Omnitrophica bacterium GWA2_41_15]HAZ11036.1 hypothetical protein [Candidatus Omnitrophota bacterium]
MFKLTIILIAGFIITPICAYAGADSGLAVNMTSCSFSEWVNTQPSNKPINENMEKIIVREQWERALGMDIFYPYFKAKELESKVREKTSVRIFKVKGKAEFKTNEAKYIFTIKF